MIHRDIVSIDHIALQVPNLQEGLHFFQELLGFKVTLEVEFAGQRIMMLKAGKIEIEMWEKETERDSSSRESVYGMHHLAVQVKDLNKVMDYLINDGIEVLSDIYEPTQGIREAIVRGPAGLRVQFVEQNVPLLIWRTIKGDFKEA